MSVMSLRATIVLQPRNVADGFANIRSVAEPLDNVERIGMQHGHVDAPQVAQVAQILHGAFANDPDYAQIGRILKHRGEISNHSDVVIAGSF
jgi:hypothetical protein